MKGRKPTPSHLKLVKGNPGHRPLPVNEPKPKRALPSPPAELNADGKEEWTRIAQELYDLGVLTHLDRGILAAYCSAWGRWAVTERKLRELEERDPTGGAMLVKSRNGVLSQNPLIRISATSAAEMRSCAAELGMTPSSRSRVQVEGGKKGNSSEEDLAAKYFS